MKNRTMKYAIAVLAVVALLAGCDRSTPPPPDPPRPPDDDPKALLMFDNIDDHSSRPFTANVNAAGRAVAEGALTEGQRVIVFHRKQAGNLIYELKRNGKSFTRDTLKKYGTGDFGSSFLTKENLSSIVADMRALVPANHYGFVFGSHGTGWLPTEYQTLPMLRRAGAAIGTADGSAGGTTQANDPFAGFWSDRADPRTRFLAGYGQKMAVEDFADALDEWEWDFLLLDDCFMAAVEALWELKEVADYVIASPTEIMMEGFPYKEVVTELFSDWYDLGAVAEAFVEAYRKKTISPYPYATVSVVKTSELAPLAVAIRKLREDPSWNHELDPVEAEVQGYEGMVKHVFSDMDDYVRKATGNESLYAEFSAQMAETVIFADHTDQFWSEFPYDPENPYLYDGGPHPVKHFSGLSVFIPWEGTRPLMDSYRNTGWYKEVYE